MWPGSFEQLCGSTPGAIPHSGCYWGGPVIAVRLEGLQYDRGSSGAVDGRVAHVKIIGRGGIGW